MLRISRSHSSYVHKAANLPLLQTQREKLRDKSVLGRTGLVKWAIECCNHQYKIILMQSSNKKQGKAIRSLSEFNPLNKFSPVARKEQRTHNYKVVVCNPDLLQSISRLQKHRVNSDSKLMNALHPQLHKKTLESVYRVNKSRSLKEILEMKLKFQEQRIQELKKKSDARHKEAQMARKKEAKIKQEEAERKAKEIEEQRQLESSWRTRTAERQKTESSFILNIHRESLTMLKRSSLLYTRSERSLADDRFRETVRNSKFMEEKRKLEKEKQKYEYQYRVAFLKNQSPPKQQLSDHKFYSSLKQKSKRLTEIYSQTQHLPALPQRKQGERSKMKETKIQKELLISPMFPRQAENKNRKSKMLNPQKPVEPPVKNETVDPKPDIKLPEIRTPQAQPPVLTPTPSPEPPTTPQTQLQLYLNTPVK